MLEIQSGAVKETYLYNVKFFYPFTCLKQYCILPIHIADDPPAPLPNPQAVAADETNNLKNSISSLEASTGTVQMSMIAVIAWVVIVTIALIALAVVTFRRWRRDYSFSTGNSVSGSSAVTDSEFGDGISNMGSVINEASTNPSSSLDGSSNKGFSYSEENLSEVCISGPSPVGSMSGLDEAGAVAASVHQSRSSTKL
jgi:hypothetical protein